MRSKKISIKTVTIIILIGIIISLILIILNMKNKNIVGQQIVKEQLGETTSDNAYVEAQLHFKEIKDEQEKLLSFKSSIATAITNEGIDTSLTDTENTMASNIASILKAKTSDATAIAEDIAEGKIAYVNGEKIIGNLKNENKSTIVKVALSTGGRGSYTINVATFITNNNIDIDYTKLTNNNFSYERTSATANTTGSIAQPSYSYNASTGILSINNPYVTGNLGIISNGIPYLYYVTN